MRLVIPDTIDRAVSEAMDDWAHLCRVSADGEMAPMTIVYRTFTGVEPIAIDIRITSRGVEL